MRAGRDGDGDVMDSAFSGSLPAPRPHLLPPSLKTLFLSLENSAIDTKSDSLLLLLLFIIISSREKLLSPACH